MVTQLEETFRSHVELAKAVNVLLSEMSARMPRTAMAPTILEQVKELKELLQTLATLPKNVGKVLEQVGTFKDLLEAGFARIATPTTTQDASGSHTLVVEKTKETLARVELLDKNLEKVHAKLGAVATTLASHNPTKAHNELAKPALEKIETFCRGKFLSLHEEVGLNLTGAKPARSTRTRWSCSSLWKSRCSISSRSTTTCPGRWHRWEVRCLRPRWTAQGRQEHSTCSWP